MPKLLIVDDDLETLKLMSKGLQATDPLLSIWTARIGIEGIVIAQRELPDMIFLDINMTEMDGFEVCERLKSDDRTRSIPIIFITANDSEPMIVRAFKAGAVDFITKPVRIPELMARMKTHLELESYRKKILAYAQQMEQLASERAKQLVYADRLATLGTLATGIAQEINYPCTLISEHMQTIQKYWDEARKSIERDIQLSADDKVKLEFILKEMPLAYDEIRSAVTQINRIVSGLKSYARKDEVEFRPVNMNDCIDQSLLLCQSLLIKSGRIEKHLELPASKVCGDRYQLVQVLVNLLTNAAHALEGHAGGIVCVSCRTSGHNVELSVEDNGPGITDKNLPKIWDPFFTTKEKGKGTGLGLSVSQGIIERHGGRISVENKSSGGARFIIHLPQAK